MRIKIYIFTLLALTGLLSAQKLPDGKRHFSRERSIDIMHMKLDLVLDMQNQKIEGTACLTLKPLHRISDFELDAIKLQIDRIRHQSGPESVDLAYRTNQSKLHIFLEKEYAPDDSMHICISYKATPRDGMYFSTNPKDPGQKYCYTYGEGGLHANWMPVYAENDDKFTSEMIVAVDPPNMVISNGRLISTSPEGKYHWRQEKPHANYLVVIYAGIFETGSLKTAGENVVRID